MVTISDWAFSECRKLSRITIPDSVHDIGEGAFSNCALLDEVEIPDSVTRTTALSVAASVWSVC